MTDLIAALLSWVALHGGYAVADQPEVVFLTPAEMTRRYHEGGHPESSTVGVIALYDPDSATVFLPEGWRSGDVIGRSQLLHELVHHAQATAKVPAVCLAEWEGQAYELQARWLRENGVADPYVAMQVDPLTVKALSMCGG